MSQRPDTYKLFPSLIPDPEDENVESQKIEKEPEICGVEMRSGEKCPRPVDECPYESHARKR